MAEFEFIDYRGELCKQWDELAFNSDDAWFWQTRKWLDYQKIYRPLLNSKDISFFVLYNGKFIGAMPFFVEEHPHYHKEKTSIFLGTIGGGGGYEPFISNAVGVHLRKKCKKAIFLEYQRRAKEIKIEKVSFRSSPLAPYFLNNPPPRVNPYGDFGFLEMQMGHLVLDLRKDIPDIFSAISKGNKSDIKRGEKFFSFFIFDKENITKEIFDLYPILHQKASGRLTRPIETFEMMFDWIKGGNGFLCATKYERKIIAFIYVSVYKSGAYYSSAADDPDIIPPAPYNHGMQWTVILYLKKYGIEFYELGSRTISSQFFYSPSLKEISISRFKDHFGAELVPVFIGEYYFCNDFFKEEYCQRINKHIDFMINKR